MSNNNYLQESRRNLEHLLNRNPGIEPGDWPLADKLRLMAVEIDINHATDPRHEVQDDLRRAADILELHAMVTETENPEATT